MDKQQLPFIPELITVHLGLPDKSSEDITLNFPDYIKNVASSEIYPTWPENAIRANIYVQISFALNRIYTEFYRSRGYSFDITSTTQHDQKFIKDRDIFDNIGKLVDDVFNNYVVRQGSIEPLFTQYCNGTTSTCSGLSQWGTVDLANQGLIPYEILQHYYGDDINIIDNAPISRNIESYRGFPMKIGSAGNDVVILHRQINRIADNYPAIPKNVENITLFDVNTERSVKSFQKIFNLTQDGIVGKATWYKIKFIYNGIKRLSELTSEGLKLEDIAKPFPTSFNEGDVDETLKPIQYHINVISDNYPEVPHVKINGIFDKETKDAILAIQKINKLPEDGIIEREVWIAIENMYESILKKLPNDTDVKKAVIFPNYYLSKGLKNDDVSLLQTYLSKLSENNKQLLSVSVTGIFDDQTVAAVIAFQQAYGLEVSGIVGPLTWHEISLVYNEL